jgi:DNA gyrase subunit A
VIRVIRASKTQPEAKEALMEIKTPGAMLQRALGEEGFAQFQQERGVADEYSLTGVQADAILKMTLGQLVNLEQEKLTEEHAGLLQEIAEYAGILADHERIQAIIRADCEMLVAKHSDKRRTEISDEEIGEVDLEDLIEEEQMVVSISHNGYIKQASTGPNAAAARGSKAPRPTRMIRSSTCSSPARTIISCSSPTREKFTGRRCTTCPNFHATPKVGLWSTC